jgi:hypothetical protein
MVDYQPIRSYNHKVPDPDTEVEEEASHDAIVDAVINVFRERNNSQSIALRISFRLPEKG